jgi:hypothetical protein
MEFAIFDLDGCVSDDRHRRELMPNTGSPSGDLEADYSEYHNACDQDPVVRFGLEAIRRAERKGFAVLFVTSRPYLYREKTVRWVQNRLGIETPTLFMRPNLDVQSSPALKVHLLKARGVRPEQIRVAFDDRQDVLQAYRAYGVPDHRLRLLDVAKMPLPFQPNFKCNPFPDVEPLDTDPARWLREGEKVFRRADGKYKDAYLVAGDVMAALFPEGVTLEGAEDFQRFGVLTQIVGKVTRYAMTLEDGGHADSAFDLSVYGSMLRAITKEGIQE